MGDHDLRGSNATHTPGTVADERDDWKDEPITVVERRSDKPTLQGMPPLARLLANQQDK